MLAPVIEENAKALTVTYEGGACNLQELAFEKKSRRGHWTEDELFFVLIALVNGVFVLEQCGLFYEDIKPRNLVLVPCSKGRSAYELRLLDAEHLLKASERFPFCCTYKYAAEGSPLHAKPPQSQVQLSFFQITRTIVSLINFCEEEILRTEDLSKRYATVFGLVSQLNAYADDAAPLKKLLLQLAREKFTASDCYQDREGLVSRIAQKRCACINELETTEFPDEHKRSQLLTLIQFTVAFRQFARGWDIISKIALPRKKRYILAESSSNLGGCTERFFIQSIKLLEHWFAGRDQFYRNQLSLKFAEHLIQSQLYEEALLVVRDMLTGSQSRLDEF